MHLLLLFSNIPSLILLDMKKKFEYINTPKVI